jgi:hypothetical protein
MFSADSGFAWDDSALDCSVHAPEPSTPGYGAVGGSEECFPPTPIQLTNSSSRVVDISRSQAESRGKPETSCVFGAVDIRFAQSEAAPAHPDDQKTRGIAGQN